MAASASASTSTTNHRYDVFINHRGPDVKKTFASHLYRRLVSHGLTAFLDQEELQVGLDFESQSKEAITTASLHVAIFSPNYARSVWCLSELVLMLESGAPIIPVFHQVNPAELWWTRGERGYARALRDLEIKTTADGQLRYNPSTVENWRNSLSTVAKISGLQLEAFDGNEGKLLDHVVKCVLKKVKKIDVFINHRGPDTKKTFASYLYHRLRFHGMEVFLDQEELQGGDNLTSTIEAAIRSSLVHVAIFSSGYAESTWCLKELVLMLESGAPIIPVFYHMKPSQLRWTVSKSKLCWAKVKRGVYAQALHKLERKKRCDPLTIENYRNALSLVAETSGFDLETTYKSDEGLLLEKLVERLLDLRKEYRGMD